MVLSACQAEKPDSPLPDLPAAGSASLAPAADILPGAAIRFEHLSIEEGLSQSVVNAIAQDQAGFLWFGTPDGLNRYDGYTFTIYKANPEDPNSLSDDWITALQPEGDGSLWIGTNQGGLHRYDPATGKISRFSDESGQENLAGANILTLFIDKDE